MTAAPRRLLELGACAAFFVSGASALAFETLWFEQAGLTFGNDVWASSSVLSAFMLGMAFGHAAAARFSNRLGSLRAFAALELVSAISGALLVLGLAVVERHFAPLAAGLTRPMLLNGARVSFAFLLLLIPSAAMGASLPALMAALAPGSPEYGRVLGALYGANTAGGVLGVAATEAFGIPRLGVQGSAFVAGGAELLVAFAAFFFASRIAVPSVAAAPVVETTEAPVVETTEAPVVETTEAPVVEARGARRGVDHRRTPWLVCSLLAGFCLLALEVVWVRVLTLFIDDTSSAFAAILAVVLAGIALGGLAGGVWLSRSKNAARQTPRVAYLSGLLGLGGYLVYPAVLQRLYLPEAPPWVVAAIACPLVLPVALGSGTLFTLFGAGLRQSVDGAAATTGQLGAVNTVGAGLGSLAAGFVLLPSIGMERSLFGLLALYGVIGIVASFRTEGGRVARWVELAAFAGFMACFPFGKVRSTFIEASAKRWMRHTGHLVEIREAKTGTIFHIRHELAGVPICDQIATNAYSMTANDYMARRYMKFFVYLPVAVHPHLSRALLLGYGMGNTAQALTDTKELERIDVVDISEEMLAMSRNVAPAPPRHPLDDPRVRVHVGDARYFLQSTSDQFDLITGEPPPPVMAHVWSLYSREYFSLLAERLSPGGLVTYWLPTMNLGAPAARSLIRGFCEAFPTCSLWNGAKENFVLLGSRDPHVTVSDERFVAQWKDPDVSPELRSLGFEFPGQLGAMFIGDAEYLARLTEDDAPLTDDFPKRLMAKGTPDERTDLIRQWRDNKAARERFRASALVAGLFPQGAFQQSVVHFENQRLLNDLLFSGPTRARQVAVLDQVLYRTPLRFPALLLLGSDPDAQRVLARVSPESERDPALLRHRIAKYLVLRDPRGALPFVRETTDSALALPGLKAYVEDRAARADRAPTPPE